MISFFTNLDEAQPYVHGLAKRWRGPVPAVGNEISFELRDRKSFSLAVVAVRFNESGDATVELHMGQATPCRSIREWTEWFKRHSGGS